MRSTLRHPRPRRRDLLSRSLRALWTLPTNVLGHTLGRALATERSTTYASEFAHGTLYVVERPVFGAVGAITLGNAILASPEFTQGLRGRVVLAHELAHTRQHDVLGPLYLPAHGILQALSAALWLVRPIEGSDPVHAHNPLEERWLFLGHTAIRELLVGERWSTEELESLLAELGV